MYSTFSFPVVDKLLPSNKTISSPCVPDHTLSHLLKTLHQHSAPLPPASSTFPSLIVSIQHIHMQGGPSHKKSSLNSTSSSTISPCLCFSLKQNNHKELSKLSSHFLINLFQLGFCPHHSSETTFPKVAIATLRSLVINLQFSSPFLFEMFS